MTESINKDMTIGDLVHEFPQCAEILLEEGVHCVGCGAAYWETIEQGLMGHGKTEEDVARIIEKMQKLASLTEPAHEQKHIKITDMVIKKLKHIREMKEKPTHGLRISVISGGCSGFQYQFDLEDTQKESDEVLSIDGVTFYFDEQTYAMLKGSTIDYVESLAASGFKIKNPNAAATCGCGQSFN